MTTSFEIESDNAANPEAPETCARLKVFIGVWCRDRDGADVEYDIEAVENLETGEDIPWDSLLPADQLRINEAAERVAYDNACDAYQSYSEGAADQAYDSWKDEQSERGE